MCGIAGIIDFAAEGTVTEEACRKMMHTMIRRGPDQNGMYAEGAARLMHTRLCVVDIENGKQPFISTGKGAYGSTEICADTSETYVLVYNGELYNTEDIRQELFKAGHCFRGHSDTEVVLHSYIEWGEACVDRFNGIFAFAVWEQQKERLFIARDRIGVKPFFYSVHQGAFVFASEMKTILAHPGIRPRVDRQGILEIMLIGPGRTPGYGVFQGIRELPPACCGMYTKEGLRTRKYWSLTDRIHQETFEETVYHVKTLVTDAIERQLVSDVPVCTFLSGGLDSSIISSIAERYFTERGKTLHTFSVGYKDNSRYFKTSKFQPNSDEAYIQMMNAYLHAEHHSVILDSEDVAEALLAAVEARDLPGMADVDSSLLLFCKEIKKHATVALSGECADEIFGGYPWFRDKEIRDQDGFPWAQSTGYRASFLRQEVLEGADPWAYVHDKYLDTVTSASVRPDCDGEERRMREMVNLNFQWFMQTLLDRKDRMSMYNGLEVRVPFCDYRIAEYLYAVPWAYKDYQGREKGLLREAMTDLLPQEVLWRKKSPYPKTHHPVYLQAVSGMLQEVLAKPAAPILDIVKRSALEELLAGTGDARENVPWYGQLMNRPQTIAYLVQVNYWMEQYGVELV